jgi:hypothetical protein
MSDNTRYPDEILRDYVKGRLPPAQASALEAAAGADPRLAAEIALVRGIVKSGDAAYCPRAASSAELGWAKLSRAIDAESRRSASIVPEKFSRWQVAAVAAIAVAVGSLVAGPLLPRGEEQGSGLEMASKQSAHAFSAQATFAPTAQESAIREALRSVGAEIVEGPSALGVYVLAFKDAEALRHGVKALRARTGVVESVQASQDARDTDDVTPP